MSTERILAGFMRYGAFAAVVVVALGIAIMALDGTAWDLASLASLTRCSDLCAASHGETVVVLGLLGLVAVSVGRLLLCSVLFLHEGDVHYSAVSAVTTLLVLASVLFRLA